jgi:hypothetical protein
MHDISAEGLQPRRCGSSLTIRMQLGYSHLPSTHNKFPFTSSHSVKGDEVLALWR